MASKNNNRHKAYSANQKPKSQHASFTTRKTNACLLTFQPGKILKGSDKNVPPYFIRGVDYIQNFKFNIDKLYTQLCNYFSIDPQVRKGFLLDLLHESLMFNHLIKDNKLREKIQRNGFNALL
jgi:hypothetical protein